MSLFKKYLNIINESNNWEKQIIEILDPYLLKSEETNGEFDSEIKNINSKRIEISHEYSNGESFENTYINIPFDLIKKAISKPENGEIEIEVDFEDTFSNTQTYSLSMPLDKAKEIIKIWKENK